MGTRWNLYGVACAALLVVVADSAKAQRRGFFFGRGSNVLTVAAVPEVAKAVELTDEQTALAKKLEDEAREKRSETFQSFRDLSDDEQRERMEKYREFREEKEKQFAESIGEKKAKRIRQLGLQASGYLAALSRDIADELNVTDDQRDDARQALRDMREEFRSAGDDADARSELAEKVNEKLASVLTDEQKKKWKEMIGAPADKELLGKIMVATRPRRRSNN